MKKLILTFLFFTSFLGFSQTQISSLDLFQVGFREKLLIYQNGKPFNGVSFGPKDSFGNKKYGNGYENKSLQEREQEKSEKRNWNDLITWKNGKKDGLYKSFNPDEILVKKGYYKNNVKDSIEESYSYNDGKLTSKYIYKMGVLNGPYVNYLDNGSINTKGTFVNGIKIGPFEEHYSDGKLLKKGVYVLGKNKDGNNSEVLNGIYEQYFFNGQLEEKSTYLKGIYNGPFESYFENGKIREKINYVNGNIVGPYESYYSDGQLRSKTVFKLSINKLNSYKDGPYEIHFPNGQIEIKCTYKMGVLTGDYVEYTEDGTLVLKEKYINGKKQ